MNSRFPFMINLSNESKRFGLVPAGLNGCISLIYLIESTLRFPPFIRRGLLPKLYSITDADEFKEINVKEFLTTCVSSPIVKMFDDASKLDQIVESDELPVSDFEYTCFLVWNGKACYVQFDSVVFLDGVKIICDLYQVGLDQCARNVMRKI